MLLAILALIAGPVSAQVVQPTDPMAQARVGHTATLLGNGTVLIAGGENGSSVTDAEIFDPATKAFLPAGTMAQRADHTASLLPDGRVLLIGGHDGTGPLASTEWYDPSTGVFTSGPALQKARTSHTATVLADGRVLVAGGDAEGTAEIYNPLDGTFTALPAQMSGPRFFASAVLLASGKVLVAGGVGTDGVTPLNSAELFDPAAGSFAPAGAAMSAGRRLPALRLLPDGKVLVIGGDADSTMEIYNAQADVFNGLAYLPPTAQLLDATLATQARAALIAPTIAQNLGLQGVAPDVVAALAAALSRADYSLTEIPQSGMALVAGGVGAGNAVLGSAFVLPASTAVVTTDKTDYAPGEVVTVTGTGFQASEQVALSLRERPDGYDDPYFVADADANGAFTFIQFAPQAIDIGRTFTLTAVGQSSGFAAQTVFTDNKNISIGFSGTGSGTVTGGTTAGSPAATFNCTSTAGVSSGSCGPSPVDNNATISLTATAATGSTIGSWTLHPDFIINSGCATGNTSCEVNINNKAGTISVTFRPKADPTVTFTGAPATATYASTFTVASTTNSSTSPVYTASGSCSNSGTTYTMTSGTGTCTSTVTWAADDNYFGTSRSQSTGAQPATGNLEYTGLVDYTTASTKSNTVLVSSSAFVTVSVGDIRTAQVRFTAVPVSGGGTQTCTATSA